MCIFVYKVNNGVKITLFKSCLFEWVKMLNNCYNQFMIKMCELIKAES